MENKDYINLGATSLLEKAVAERFKIETEQNVQRKTNAASRRVNL